MQNDLEKICKLVLYDILTSTSDAGSGHPSSSLSAVELTVSLFFGGYFHYDIQSPHSVSNDRFILSKGHASPLLYSLFQATGGISEEDLKTLRKFGSSLEGHPTPNFPFADVATGSLGQGLSIGLGMALGQRLLQTNSHVFVLLGDSELAEGQNWEAAELASFYKTGNLVAILDVNRLGQRGETMLGWDIEQYAKRFESFGWETILVPDGHDLEEIDSAYLKASHVQEKPVVIIAKTVKGKGVQLLEDQEGWHGKTLDEEQLKKALEELGEVDLKIKGVINKPNVPTKSEKNHSHLNVTSSNLTFKDPYSTREAYGDALTVIGENRDIVALDAEVSNSTFSEKFKQKFPERFFEMFIAEQNMISAALGMSKLGFIPFVSTFAAFLTRAFDQIRMSQYSNPNLKIVGSHAGVSIGADGPSQMGLEDIALFRSILDSTVLYPSDAVSASKLAQIMAKNNGLFYLRTTREKTPIIYSANEEFEIGGSKILKQSENDQAVIFTAGITLFEALKASEELQKENIQVAVVDLYSVKPLDEKTIKDLAGKTKKVVVVEDHYPAGGLGEAVKSVLSGLELKISHLCVKKIPRSGKLEELFAYEKIDAAAIIEEVKSLLL